MQRDPKDLGRQIKRQRTQAGIGLRELNAETEPSLVAHGIDRIHNRT